MNLHQLLFNKALLNLTLRLIHVLINKISPVNFPLSFSLINISNYNPLSNMTSKNFTLREARKDDCKAISGLIQELAKYEKMEGSSNIDENVLIKDGFGEDPFFYAFVAEVDGDNEKLIVGYCLYFYVYSSWDGRTIYMEDLFVNEEHRGKGIGIALWKAVAEAGVKKGCKRMDFCVLNWNQNSIEFYLKQGAFDVTKEAKFHIYRLEQDKLEKLAGKELA